MSLYRFAALLLLMAFGTPGPAFAQFALPQAPMRSLASSALTVAGTAAHMLADPRQNLVSTFLQEVTYDVGSTPASLHLEVHGIGSAFDQLRADIQVVGFEAISATGTPATPGSSTGSHRITDGSGPVVLLTGIMNMRVTVKIQVTVTLSSRYSLSGNRAFLFEYMLQ